MPGGPDETKPLSGKLSTEEDPRDEIKTFCGENEASVELLHSLVFSSEGGTAEFSGFCLGQYLIFVTVTSYLSLLFHLFNFYIIFVTFTSYLSLLPHC